MTTPGTFALVLGSGYPLPLADVAEARTQAAWGRAMMLLQQFFKQAQCDNNDSR